MKADLTLPETREAFAAQYWGQNVMEIYGYSPLTRGKYSIQNVDRDTIRHMDYKMTQLSLRHISSLTEDEKQTVEEIEDCDDPYSPGFIEWPSLVYKSNEPGHRYERWLTLESHDYLRSIGILIPYRGNSCEELIAANLAVYRKEGE